MKEVIQMTREQLADFGRKLIIDTLSSIGIRPGRNDMWMPQSEAYRLAGRRRIDRAIKDGRVKFKKENMDTKQSRVMVRVEDVQKLIRV